jgi:hypothetical protein
MDKLAEYEQRFSKPRDRWTKAQWREVAETLAAPAAPAKRGRPRKPEGQQKPVWSATANYQALAHEVVERMARDGSKNIRKTVERVMQESRQHNEIHAKEDYGDLYDPSKPAFKVMRESRIKDMLETTYSAVRKEIARWKKKAEHK